MSGMRKIVHHALSLFTNFKRMPKGCYSIVTQYIK